MIPREQAGLPPRTGIANNKRPASDVKEFIVHYGDGKVGNRYDWIPAGNNRANAECVVHATTSGRMEVTYAIGVSSGSFVTSGTYRNLDLVVRDIGPTPEDSATVAGASGDAPPSVVNRRNQTTR